MSQVQTSCETSFVELFGLQIEKQPVVNRIEIPLIQRDYAQGRLGASVARIRKDFLDALCKTILPGGKPIKLDFVYGDVNDGTLYPLDGQQRLTTLFLMHWYLAWRSGVPTKNQPWMKFTYATRPGARSFCERLAEYRPSETDVLGGNELSGWIADQPWYLYTWINDPTIQSILVMLDGLHQRFNVLNDIECTAAWQRLTNAQNPAISFHLLPMSANGQTETLYIKMNSRGKPLTAFENFKAHFEAMIKSVHTNKLVDFTERIDTKWADTLWHYRGTDNLIDDEFMRYFRFITEVCAWLGSVSFSDETSIDILAEKIYGAGNLKSAHNLKFLFQVFDTWDEQIENEYYIKNEFESLLTVTPGGSSVPLLLFNAFKPRDGESPVDFFASCYQRYGESGQGWTLSHTLLLYAVIIDRIHKTDNFSRQLRVLRNLIEASANEIRRENMPQLLADVDRIVVDGSLQGVDAFNKAQITNENYKTKLLSQHPMLQTTLHHLEDHKLLRGCLAVFDLDPSISTNIFVQRVDAFHALFDNSDCWPELTGTMLSIGDYSRRSDRWTGYHFSEFGAPESETPWRDLFRGKKEERHHPVTSVLMSLLDQVATANNNLTCLQSIQQVFIQQCEIAKEMDWRYYFVKYAIMREGKSGRYAIDASGYCACMLNNPSMRGYYRDPYLLASWHISGVGPVISDPWPLFEGYENKPRKMILQKSGIRLQCVDAGWQISETPTSIVQKEAYDQVCLNYGIDQTSLYAVPQNNSIDTSDRVSLGAKLLNALVSAGL